MPTALGIVQKFFPHVSTVKDAKVDVTVEVTGKDTRSSSVKSHKACAMAVACQRTFHLDGVIISRSVAYLIKGSSAIRYLVKDALAREIIAFDKGGAFAPGAYELEHPGVKNRLGHDWGHRYETRTAKTKRAKPKHFTQGVRAALTGVGK